MSAKIFVNSIWGLFGHQGHTDHILSGSGGFNPVYKYLGLTQILHWIPCINNKAIADGLVGQVLARLLFLKVKTNFHFTELKQRINKSTRVVFGLVQLVLL